MKIARYILLLLLTALLAWGMLWAQGKAGDERVKRVEVQVTNAQNVAFVTPQGILNELANAHITLTGKPMWQIDADSVERLLARSPYLENVDCVKAQNGVFLIKARQLVPVMRVFDGDNSYYVNREGKQMRAVPNYHVDVPVVEGHFTRAYPPQRLLPMIDYVNRDATLSAIVTMYSFHDPDNIFIIPCFKGHVVNMGNTSNIANKFKKLLLFYRKVMPQKGWNTYDTISVKWDHQVVATLRDARPVKVQQYDPNEDEPMPDLQTMTATDNHIPATHPDAQPAATAPAATGKSTKQNSTN